MLGFEIVVMIRRYVFVIGDAQVGHIELFHVHQVDLEKFSFDLHFVRLLLHDHLSFLTQGLDEVLVVVLASLGLLLHL